MAGTIDELFDSIVKDAENIAKDIGKSAAEKAQKGILREARSCLKEYYNNYDPQMYKRTNRLKKIIVPVFEDKSDSKEICYEVGVEFDSNKLKGMYRSNSWYHKSGTEWFGRDDPYFDWNSSNNGVPEPWWIMDNFLEGIHPWAQVDDDSTSDLLINFINGKLEKTIMNYTQKEMSKKIMTAVKNYGR